MVIVNCLESLSFLSVLGQVSLVDSVYQVGGGTPLGVHLPALSALSLGHLG